MPFVSGQDKLGADIKDLVENYIFQGQFKDCLTYIRLKNNGTKVELDNFTNIIISTQYENRLPDMNQFNFQCLISFAYFDNLSDYQELQNLIRVSIDTSHKMMVVFGNNFETFISQFNAVQSKFLFVEQSESKEFQKFYSYCPNCTESWINASQVWSPNRGFLLPKENPFHSCGNPLEGKTLKVVIGGAYPAVYM